MKLRNLTYIKDNRDVTKDITMTTNKTTTSTTSKKTSETETKKSPTYKKKFSLHNLETSSPIVKLYQKVYNCTTLELEENEELQSYEQLKAILETD